MSDHRTKSILLHILEDLSDIQQFVDGATLHDFQANKMMQKAVCMSLLNIGEGINHIPMDFRNRHQEIPWERIIGLRNRTAHGYHTLIYDVIWDIAQNDLQVLIPVIKDELKRLRMKDEQSR